MNKKNTTILIIAYMCTIRVHLIFEFKVGHSILLKSSSNFISLIKKNTDFNATLTSLSISQLKNTSKTKNPYPISVFLK